MVLTLEWFGLISNLQSYEFIPQKIARENTMCLTDALLLPASVSIKSTSGSLHVCNLVGIKCIRASFQPVEA